jgi:hypothetical protein
VYTSFKRTTEEGTTFEEFTVDVPRRVVLWRYSGGSGWEYNVGYIGGIEDDRITIQRYCGSVELVPGREARPAHPALGRVLVIGACNNTRYICPLNRIESVIDAVNSGNQALANEVCLQNNPYDESMWQQPLRVSLPGELRPCLASEDLCGVVVAEDVDESVTSTFKRLGLRARSLTIQWKSDGAAASIQAGMTVFAWSGENGGGQTMIKIVASVGDTAIGVVQYSSAVYGTEWTVVGHDVYARARE